MSTAAYRAAHREQERARAAKWAADNPGRKKANDAAYREAHPDHRVRSPRWHEAHREINRLWAARWRASHPEELRIRQAEYAASHPEVRRALYERRRARMAGVVHETFSLADVAIRDGNRCGICGGAVKADPKFPDPKSASVDHIMPISQGGAHALDNVQLAHLGCNAAKGARDTIPAQLRMFG